MASSPFSASFARFAYTSRSWLSRVAFAAMSDTAVPTLSVSSQRGSLPPLLASLPPNRRSGSRRVALPGARATGHRNAALNPQQVLHREGVGEERGVGRPKHRPQVCRQVPACPPRAVQPPLVMRPVAEKGVDTVKEEWAECGAAPRPQG